MDTLIDSLCPRRRSEIIVVVGCNARQAGLLEDELEKLAVQKEMGWRRSRHRLFVGGQEFHFLSVKSASGVQGYPQDTKVYHHASCQSDRIAGMIPEFEPLKPTREQIQEIEQDLVGTCKTVREVLAMLELDFDDCDVAAMLEGVGECEECNWWCEISELEYQSDGILRCDDCKPDGPDYSEED